jgi:hypothetical protein
VILALCSAPKLSPAVRTRLNCFYSTMGDDLEATSMNDHQQSSELLQLYPPHKAVSLKVSWILCDGQLTAKWDADTM